MYQKDSWTKIMISLRGTVNLLKNLEIHTTLWNIMEFFIGLHDAWVYFILAVGNAFTCHTHKAHLKKEISNWKPFSTYPPKNQPKYLLHLSERTNHLSHFPCSPKKKSYPKNLFIILTWITTKFLWLPKKNNFPNKTILFLFWKTNF